MAIDQPDGHGGPHSHEPAKTAKIVWWIGMALLALLVAIAVRSFLSGGEQAVESGDKAEAAH